MVSGAEWGSQRPKAGGNREEELSGALKRGSGHSLCSMNPQHLFCLSLFYSTHFFFYQLLLHFVCLKLCV